MANLIQSEYTGLLQVHSNKEGLSSGKELYNNICAACHGSKADIKYKGIVPNLCDVKTITDYAWHYKKRYSQPLQYGRSNARKNQNPKQARFFRY
ncbi:MAG: c-type cytochrome [Campylobacter sp.]|nr:c-type cytochrome [Campylobacter sp.]